MLLLLLAPVACNAVLLLATEVHTSIQMTGAMALCIPVFLCALDALELSTRWKKMLCGILCLALAATLYGDIWQVELDQFALSSGKTATVTLANEVLHSLNDAGYLDAETPICIVGSPGNNPLFRVTDKMYVRANDYAKFGNLNGANGTAFADRGWEGVFKHLCGVKLAICTDDEYDKIVANPEVKAMPLFPAEGSIARNADGMVVVKIANVDAQA